MKTFVMSRKNEILIVFLLLIPVILLWNTSWLLPLKILVVMFHELSHALMTWVTGGEVVSFDVNLQQGGSVTSAGGNRFLTLNAGYLGSLFMGYILMASAGKTKHGRVLSGLISLILLIIVIFHVRTAIGLTLCITAVLLFALLSFKTHPALLRITLLLIGLTSLCYVPLDIYSDTLTGSIGRSDASMLADEYGGFTWLWGGVWLGLSLVIIFFVLRKLIRSAQ